MGYMMALVHLGLVHLGRIEVGIIKRKLAILAVLSFGLSGLTVGSSTQASGWYARHGYVNYTSNHLTCRTKWQNWHNGNGDLSAHTTELYNSCYRVRVGVYYRKTNGVYTTSFTSWTTNTMASIYKHNVQTALLSKHRMDVNAVSPFGIYNATF